jgi:transcriptional regulator with XRE-family HTH domain
MPTMKNKRLQTYLLKRKLTPAAVAAKGDVSQATVYGLINGTTVGTPRTRYALAAALGETVDAVDRLIGKKK